jgi:tetratricopeptide (TPR) repeat protein
LAEATDIAGTLEVSRLGRLGERHRLRGEVAEAEVLLRRAVALAKATCHNDVVTLARALNGLGLVCKDAAKYDEARALYERALSLLQRLDDPDLHDVATIYHNLGGIEHARGNYTEAQPFARLSVETRTRAAVPDDAALAGDMVALAAILDGLKEYDEAERLYLDALQVLETAPETNAREIAVTLNDLGAEYHRRGLSALAEAQLVRAAALKRQVLGDDHHELAVTLNNLAVLYKSRRDFARAKPLFEEAVAILEKSLGCAHPKAMASRENLRQCVADSDRGCKAP